MRITLQAARVYGSKSQYGPTPRLCPGSGPIALDGYPAPPERSWILLGAPPESILRADRVRRAIGWVSLPGGFGKAADPGAQRDMLIEQALEGEDAQPAREPNWYVTVVVEREIDLQEGFVGDSKYLWVEERKAMELETDFRSYASPHLDVLAACASTIIDSGFFEEVIVNDRVFFCAPGRESFGLPSFSVGAIGVVIKTPLESLALTELERRLHCAARLPPEKLQSLDTVARWHLAAIAEHDPWKRFFWSFLALEVLTNRLFAALHNRVKSNVDSRPAAQTDADPLVLALPHLIRPQGEFNLGERFKVVALCLFPGGAARDLRDFQRAKKARDNLAHGELSDVRELPIGAVRSLLERYLDRAVAELLPPPQPPRRGGRKRADR